MTHADKARFHSDPANWKLGIFYFCRSDSRIFVPKRIQGLGWTLNLGAGSETRFVIVLLVAVGVLAIFHWLSHRSEKATAPKADPETRAP